MGRQAMLHLRFAPIVILCHSRKAALRVLENVTRYLSQRLRLTVNKAKAKRRQSRMSGGVGGGG